MSDPSIVEVRRLLQAALELELFTIPPYLTALYSIREGRNEESAQIIQGVAMEEMLHIALVANVLNAIGGRPVLSTDDGRGLPRRRYPSAAPHVDLDVEVSLQRFSRASIEVFQKIEEPETWEPSAGSRFSSIGQFYEFLLDRLIAVCADLGEASVFIPVGPERQIHSRDYYGGGGGIRPVLNLADAKDMLDQVSQQGEERRTSNQSGDSERFGQPKEVAHYFRFEQILEQRYYDRDDDVGLAPGGPELRVDWSAVYPMRDNPEPNATQPDGVGALLADFEARYQTLLNHIHRGLNGQPKALDLAIGEMHAVRHLSIALMKIDRGDGTTYGPPFWYLTST